MTMTPKDLKAALDAGEKLRLIDVREADEWAKVKIEGAELIPLTEFQRRAPQELDPEEKIVLYCHHGMRSARAQGFLKGLGYQKVINLTGGIDAWAVQIAPALPRY